MIISGESVVEVVVGAALGYDYTCFPGPKASISEDEAQSQL